MKQIFAAGAAGLCVLVFVAAVPSPSAAGGYGYHHGFGHHKFGHHKFGHHGFGHHGFGHHGFGHRRYGSLGFRHFGFSRFGFRHHGYGGYHHGYAYRPRGYYEEPWPADDPAPVYAEPEVYAEPLPAPTLGSCRQVREYQTQIYVGGKSVQAYGQACLQPDGSWSYGVPKVRRD